VISVHTHGAAKQANLVPASARHAHPGSQRAHTSRVAFVQAKRKNKPRGGDKRSNPNAAGPSNPTSGGGKALEDVDKRIERTKRLLARQEEERRQQAAEAKPRLGHPKKN